MKKKILILLSLGFGFVLGIGTGALVLKKKAPETYHLGQVDQNEARRSLSATSELSSHSVRMTVQEIEEVPAEFFSPSSEMIEKIVKTSGIPLKKGVKIGFARVEFGTRHASLKKEGVRQLAQDESKVDQALEVAGETLDSAKEKTREFADGLSEEGVQEAVRGAGETAENLANSPVVQGAVAGATNATKDYIENIDSEKVKDSVGGAGDAAENFAKSEGVQNAVGGATNATKDFIEGVDPDAVSGAVGSAGGAVQGFADSEGVQGAVGSATEKFNEITTLDVNSETVQGVVSGTGKAISSAANSKVVQGAVGATVKGVQSLSEKVTAENVQSVVSGTGEMISKAANSKVVQGAIDGTISGVQSLSEKVTAEDVTGALSTAGRTVKNIAQSETVQSFLGSATKTFKGFFGSDDSDTSEAKADDEADLVQEARVPSQDTEIKQFSDQLVGSLVVDSASCVSVFAYTDPYGPQSMVEAVVAGSLGQSLSQQVPSEYTYHLLNNDFHFVKWSMSLCKVSGEDKYRLTTLYSDEKYQMFPYSVADTILYN